MTRIKKWQVLSRKDVSPSRWFPLFVDKVKLPNDLIIEDYYVSELGDVSMIIPVTSDQKILFVEQYKHGVKDITLELPAGRIDKLSPLQAAEKELAEETGLKAQKMDFIGQVFVAPAKDSTRTNIFVAQGLKSEPGHQAEPGEIIYLVYLPANKINQCISEGKIKTADTIAALFLAQQKFPRLFK